MDDFGYNKSLSNLKDSKEGNSDLLTADIMLKHTKSGSIKREDSAVKNIELKKLDKDPTGIPLPQRFVVKYLSFRETSHLWGIKYTRGPVDEMVEAAKSVLMKNPEKGYLPLLKIEVNEDGILVAPMPQNTNKNCPEGKFSIESISYGVQDIVYTRVFAMIVVNPSNTIKMSTLNQTSSGPYRCHAFVTDTRENARNLTYALASAFDKFSQKVKAGKISIERPRRVAIDLRTENELETELLDESSEA